MAPARRKASVREGEHHWTVHGSRNELRFFTCHGGHARVSGTGDPRAFARTIPPGGGATARGLEALRSGRRLAL